MPPRPARFEAYMMTGDLILNLSRTPQSSGILPMHAKKVDSLRDSPRHQQKRVNGAAPQAKYDSSPSSSSPSISDREGSGDSTGSMQRPYHRPPGPNNNHNEENSYRSPRHIQRPAGASDSQAMQASDDKRTILLNNSDNDSDNDAVDCHKVRIVQVHLNDSCNDLLIIFLDGTW